MLPKKFTEKIRMASVFETLRFPLAQTTERVLCNLCKNLVGVRLKIRP